MPLSIRLFILTVVFTYLATAPSLSQILEYPDNHKLIDSVQGDLDGDGIMELAAVFNVKHKDFDKFESIPRRLIIYKNLDGKWSDWYKSDQAIYGSGDGGIMGDPFVTIDIEKGILITGHYGGSAWRWGHTDKYRYQDGDFYLIGYESINGHVFEYFKKVNFNLSTGKLIVRKEFMSDPEDKDAQVEPDEETFFKRGLKITLAKREEKEIHFTSPKYGYDIYIAVGKDNISTIDDNED